MRVLVSVHSRVIENDASRTLLPDGSLMVKMFFNVILHLISTLDTVFESGKLGSRIFDGAHGVGYSMGLVA